jgi:hypothetical protein
MHGYLASTNLPRKETSFASALVLWLLSLCRISVAFNWEYATFMLLLYGIFKHFSKSNTQPIEIRDIESRSRSEH